MQSPVSVQEMSANSEINGRGDWIRTSDPLLPKQMRYQAALLPALRGIAECRIGRALSPNNGSVLVPGATGAQRLSLPMLRQTLRTEDQATRHLLISVSYLL